MNSNEANAKGLLKSENGAKPLCEEIESPLDRSQAGYKRSAINDTTSTISRVHYKIQKYAFASISFRGGSFMNEGISKFN